MGRLIDGDALERERWSLHRTFQEDKNTMVYEVKKPSDFPTIEERKTGKWDDIGGIIRYGCPFCHHAYESMYNYCPNCGARLVQEREDNG